jgi:phosphatidate cytidylyltransferase
MSTVVLVGVIALGLSSIWATGIALTVFICLGMYEYFLMLEHKQIMTYKYFGTAVAALIPLSIAFRFEPTRSWELLCIVASLVFLFLMQFTRRQNSGALVGISTTIFGVLYISWFLSFLIKLRMLPNGLWLVCSVLLITKMGDIGCYLVGTRFGKRPLIPRISPKKSVEGAIGGLVFSMLAAMVFQPVFNFSFWHLSLIGLGLGILGQLGDLSESLLKRDCQIKDSGNLIPGLGGVLDAVDSLIFTAPVFYFYISSLER